MSPNNLRLEFSGLVIYGAGYQGGPTNGLYRYGSDECVIDFAVNNDIHVDTLLDQLIGIWNQPSDMNGWPSHFDEVQINVHLPYPDSTLGVQPVKSYVAKSLTHADVPAWLAQQRRLVRETLRLWQTARFVPEFYKKVFPTVLLESRTIEVPREPFEIRAESFDTPGQNKAVVCQHCGGTFMTADDSEMARCPRCNKESIVHG